MSGLHFRDRDSPALSPYYLSKIVKLINNLHCSPLLVDGCGSVAHEMIFSDGSRVHYSVSNYLAPALLLCREALAGAQLGSDGFYLFRGKFRNIGDTGGHRGAVGGGTTV